MTFLVRAAVPAAVFVCGAVLIGTSTPGFAQTIQAVKLDSVPVAAINALANAPVPTTGPMQDQPAPSHAVVQTAPVEPAVTAEAPALADEDPDFDTLADAVAAQDLAMDDDRELRCLASGVYHESKGEPLAGQFAVAKVILNRTRSGRFPKSVCGVLTQRGQFSFVRGGTVPSGRGRNWETAVAVAKVAQRELWDTSAADKALFFHASHVSPGWRKARVARIGNHVFYR